MSSQEVRLVECELAQPIERIRGGAVIVAVKATFEVAGSERVSFVGFHSSDELDVFNSFDLAVNNAISNFNKYCGLSLGTPSSTIKLFIKNRTNELREVAINKGQAKKIPLEEIESALNGPADEERQNSINIVCDTLGIARIDVLNDSWSLLESQALLAVLEDLAKPLELK